MPKKKREEKSYTIHVVGEAESPFRGAVPKSIDNLVKKPGKDVATLVYQVSKSQVELCLQAGDIAGAVEAIKKYQEQQHEFANPLNVFKRDHQNGNWPYQGAHTVFGAFRDAARFLFPEFFWQKGKGKADRPSNTHLRKFVKVTPNHIFFHRPDMSNGVITKPDGIEGQQPVGAVKGFARYEVIESPFQFAFKMAVNPKGPFGNFLGNKDLVIETIKQSVNHGLGSSRSAGYGMWEIADLKVT